MEGMLEYIWPALLALGLPTAVTGLIVRRFEKRLEERDKQQEKERKERERRAEERERNREELGKLQLQSIMATICLSEATARAVQRIPDAKCNGDMTAALAKVDKIRNSHRQFLTTLGLHSLYDE